MQAGRLRHRIRLEAPTDTDDGAGGFSSTWAVLSPSVVSASVETATAERMERVAAGTVASDASHIVSMRYHAGVTTKTRILLGSRVLNVVGVRDVDERHIETIALCTEVVV